MRTLFLFLASLLGVFLSGLSVNATDNQRECTMQYAPVCGSVQVQCIRAPCNPIRQTFGNACVASVAWATDVTQGECGTIVGGDQDVHGCIPSAGYSWDADLGKCARPWETKNLIFAVAPNTVSCVGVGSLECLRVRIGGSRNWMNWYDTIRNFTYEVGYTYRLRVKSSPVETLLTDSSSREYALAKVIQKIPLMGTSWVIESLNGKASTAAATLSFTRNTIRAHACNSIFGSYTLSGNTISTSNLMSTKMACQPGDASTIDGAMNLSDATWSIKDGKLTLTTGNVVMVWKIQ